MDFADVVRRSLEAGETPDHVAQALLDEHHLLPISAIKALRSGSSMTPAEVKDVIQRNLAPARWAAAEPLWEMIAPTDTE